MQGKILGSRYQVIEYIGKGGFGKTYLATDTLLPGKDRCVVKQLYPSVDDPNFVKAARRLFKREAETLHSVGNHDQIPQLMAYFEEEEKFYLVQQYIEGHTLSKELTLGQTWAEAKVIELLLDCADILEFIHSKGVIHRDVKPDNLIRRSSDNKLVLVDFGSVKEVIVEQTKMLPSTVAVGTRGYMPSEQARGMPRPTSDIYALGVIGIQALTGIAPLALCENEQGELIWQDRAIVSPQLAAVLTKMTQDRFQNRYQSAKEVTEALNQLQASKVVLPKTEAANKYTPTVQLDASQLANLPGATRASSAAPPPPKPRSEVVSSSVSGVPSDNSVVEPEISPVTSQQTSESPDRENHEVNSATKSNLSTNLSNKYKTLATLGVAVVIGAIATGGMYLLDRQNKQNAQASVAEQEQELNEMLEEKSFAKCYDRTEQMAQDATATAAMPEEKLAEFKARCGLEMAKKEANNLKFREALAIAKTLPRSTSLKAEIQSQEAQWSERVLQQASKMYLQEGKLKEALELAEQIPNTIPDRDKVVNAKESWKSDFQTNEAIIAAASEELERQNWQAAKQQAARVKNSPSGYWRKRATEIISQADEAIAKATPETTPPATNPPQQQTPPDTIKPPVKSEPKPPAIAPEKLRDLGDGTNYGKQDSPELRDLGDGVTPQTPSSPSGGSLRDL